jgi:hypothetical protein
LRQLETILEGIQLSAPNFALRDLKVSAGSACDTEVGKRFAWWGKRLRGRSI